MVDVNVLGDGRGKPRQQPFALLNQGGGSAFTPAIYPERVQMTKERNLDRSQNYCKGEDVSDNGAKNADIHINGVMTRNGIDSLNEIGNNSDEYTLVSATWSGEVLVSTIEIEGPTGWWPEQNTMLWEYRIDVVSTGTDESMSDGGVISDGRDINPSDRRLYELAEEMEQETNEQTQGVGSSGLVE